MLRASCGGHATITVIVKRRASDRMAIAILGRLEWRELAQETAGCREKWQGNSHAHTTTDLPVDGYYAAPGFFEVNVARVSQSGSGSLFPNSFLGGIQAGYNIQADCFVFGIEVDYGSFNMDATRTVVAPYADGAPVDRPFTITSATDTTWLFTTRGRVGWIACNNMLFYVTGGLALTDLEVRNSFLDQQTLIGREAASNRENVVGWTIGGGLEMPISRHWTLRAEYLFVEFPNVTTAGRVTNPNVPGQANTLTTASDLSGHMARVSLNFKF